MRTKPTGEQDTRKVSSTVDVVVTFAPKTIQQAQDIAKFLNKRCSAIEEMPIPDSYIIPDIRTTLTLANVLGSDYRVIKANAFRRDDASEQVLVLRRQTEFHQRWRVFLTQVNNQIADYVASEELGVLP